jgi:ribose 1,5-bisphosphate isomerase
LESIRITSERIRRLEVQGARNVAISAIKALEEFTKSLKVRNKKEFLQNLLGAKETLFNARPTEPLMRNAIRHILYKVENSEEERPKALVDLVSIASKEFLKSLQKSVEEIAKMGSNRISSSSKILTHCHSSTVNYALKRAKDDGKIFEVICTESRPVFQGRITARELLKSGIKTTMIVDSAVRFFMNEVDMVLVGADAITSEGNIVNKIGTSLVALAAHEARTPFYVLSELLKFDPLTTYGEYTKIEERGASEVWEGAPPGLMIRNPAFDVTRKDFIHGIVCEDGMISPPSVAEVVRRRYPWALKNI